MAGQPGPGRARASSRYQLAQAKFSLRVRFRWMTSLSHPGECHTALYMFHLQDVVLIRIVWDLAYRQGHHSDLVLHVSIVREQDYFLNNRMISMCNFCDDR